MDLTKLTPDQIAFFRERGYLAIEAITTADEVERLSARSLNDFLRPARVAAGSQFDLAGPMMQGAARLPQF